MIQGEVRTVNQGAVAVSEDGSKRAISSGAKVAVGDFIENGSSSPLEILLTSQIPGEGANLLILQPGAKAEIVELASAGDLSQTMKGIVYAQSEGVELVPVDDEDPSGQLDETQEGSFMGLVGTGVLEGSVLGALGLGAVAAASFNGSEDTETPENDSDDEPVSLPERLDDLFEDTDGDGTADPTVVEAITTGSDGLDDIVEATLLEPVVDPITTIVGSDDGQTSGVAAGVEALGDTLAQDESILAPVTSETVAPFISESDDGQTGTVSVVTAITDGIEVAAEETPVEPVVDAVTTVVGSDDGQTSGVAVAVEAIGDTLANDESILAPVTSDTVAPYISESTEETTTLPEAIVELGDVVEPVISEEFVDTTLEAVVAEESPLAPVAPVVEAAEPVVEAIFDVAPFEPVVEGFETAIDTVSVSVEDAGKAIVEAGQEDPTGVVPLVGEALGGGQMDNNPPDEPDEEPADSVTDITVQLVTSVDEMFEGTPVEPIIEPVAEYVGSENADSPTVVDAIEAIGGAFESDESLLSPVTADLVGPVVGASDEETETGLPGALDSVADGLTGLTDEESDLAPLAPVTDVASEVVKGGGQGGRGIGQLVRETAGGNDDTGVPDFVADLVGGKGGRGRGISTREDSDLGLDDPSGLLG